MIGEEAGRPFIREQRNMKYIILQGDGMADYPLEVLGGKTPLEAASMGVALGPNDIAFRCNLVTLGVAGDETFMEDFTSGHISTEEAGEIIRDLGRELGGAGIEFFPGVSYRHLMVWRNGKEKMSTTPPHDITDQNIAG